MTCQDGVNEVLTGINYVVNDFEARLTLALDYVGINGFSIPSKKCHRKSI